MTSNSGHAPRIYRVGHEPTALPPAVSVVACPHCGGTVHVAAPAVEAVQRSTVRVTGPAGLPEAGPVRGPVGRVLGLVFEVIDGRRPAEQLTRVVTAPVLRYIRAARLERCPARVSRLLSLKMCRPTDGAVEAAAVAALETRIRAVAARFEHDPSGWRCVALRIL